MANSCEFDCGQRAVGNRSGGWMRRALARIAGKQRGQDQGSPGDRKGSPAREAVRRARDSVCPERAAEIARAKLAALGIAVLVGCSGVQSVAPLSRLECYAQADREAQQAVDALCPPDAGAFTKCPAHDAIMVQLQKDQEACK